MRHEREIGLAVDTVGSYGREIIQGVMSFCHLNPHWVIAMEPRLWVYDERPDLEAWSVEGLIIQGYDEEVTERVHAAGTPAINVSNMGTVRNPLPTIVPDDLAIGRMAAEYLMSLKFQHFGYCAHGVYEFSRLRGEAFHSTLAEGGFTAHECDTARSDLKSWLASLPTPVAVFCCNDAWAHRALTACRRAKLRVPDQIAVLGVDDDELLNTVGGLPMSSIAIPAAKVGFEAARMLECLLDGTPAPMLTKLPPLSVVARATTQMANDTYPEVNDALNFIRLNISRLIQVNDVVGHLSISRRSLERRFRRALGRSVGSEIRLAHVERAKQLLTHTSLSVEEVALASGFANATMLGVHFRRYLQESPTTFRRRSSTGVSARRVEREA